MKKIFLISLLLFFTSCGYQAVYKNIDNENLKISIRNVNGDNEVNNLIKNRLQRYISKNIKDSIILDISTEYSKLVLSKDLTGKASDLQLTAKSSFTITYKDIEEKFIIEESLNIENSSNAYEQNNYENVIRNNFASSISQKLILKLISIK